MPGSPEPRRRRELATRGIRVLVLEAREQIGGRTFTSSLSDGELIELGRTYVHWTQPHTWPEMTRYGLIGDVIPAEKRRKMMLTPADGPEGLEWAAPEDEFSPRQFSARALLGSST